VYRALLTAKGHFRLSHAGIAPSSLLNESSNRSQFMLRCFNRDLTLYVEQTTVQAYICVVKLKALE